MFIFILVISSGISAGIALWLVSNLFRITQGLNNNQEYQKRLEVEKDKLESKRGLFKVINQMSNGLDEYEAKIMTYFFTASLCAKVTSFILLQMTFWWCINSGIFPPTQIEHLPWWYAVLMLLVALGAPNIFLYWDNKKIYKGLLKE
ncbi:MAG: hypothetical protein ABIJ81_00940 [Patescibacteria group bacterium]